jgi:hypothetical protein
VGDELGNGLDRVRGIQERQEGRMVEESERGPQIMTYNPLEWGIINLLCSQQFKVKQHLLLK